VLDRVQKKVAKFANLTNESNWEMLAERRKLAWKVIGVITKTILSQQG
jgi:hypothetical protein